MVLDASAILALLSSEPGADMVASVIPRGLVSAVNLSEVVAKLTDAAVPNETIHEAIEGLGLDIVPFDVGQAYDAGLLRSLTRAAGLSMGDRACLSLARRLGLPALTADRAWSELGLGVDVEMIR